MVLTSVAVRIAAGIRSLALCYIVLLAVIWHGYYAANPWRLAAPVAATVWGAVFVIWLIRRPPTARVAVADSAVHIGLALSAVWSVPPLMRGDVANWIFILLAGQTVVPMWFAPVAMGAPLAGTASAAYWVGAVVSGPAPATRIAPGASAVLLVAVAMVAWSAYRMLRRRAALADAALAGADADEHQRYVALSLSTQRREHERLLHDTVLNTLTALARGGATDAGVRGIVGRCRHDVALIEYALAGPGGPGEPPAESLGGLAAVAKAVTAEMRARGLTVHLDIEAQPQAPPVPVPTVTAIGRAMRESLDNVARHAGTNEAWVRVRACPPDPAHTPAAPDVGGEHGECLVVTVRDRGAGFDPSCVAPDRLGIRRSIVERVADFGGSVSVRSAPGTGTTVTLCWPGSAA